MNEYELKLSVENIGCEYEFKLSAENVTYRLRLFKNVILGNVLMSISKLHKWFISKTGAIYCSGIHPNRSYSQGWQCFGNIPCKGDHADEAQAALSLCSQPSGWWGCGCFGYMLEHTQQLGTGRNHFFKHLMLPACCAVARAVAVGKVIW